MFLTFVKLFCSDHLTNNQIVNNSNIMERIVNTDNHIHYNLVTIPNSEIHKLNRVPVLPAKGIG